MTAEGPRKGEPSRKTMRYGRKVQPALLVRGSSRRIMFLRFRPAYISVINRRACSRLSSALLFSSKTQGSPAGTVLHRAAHSKLAPNATTVLAGKGALRSYRTLARSAPFRLTATTMGGSGGNVRSGLVRPTKHLTGRPHISFPAVVLCSSLRAGGRRQPVRGWFGKHLPNHARRIRT